MIEQIQITNPQKILCKKTKTTKLDVIEYYQKVAPLMMPFLQGRPLSVIRCHQDVSKQGFFLKNSQNLPKGSFVPIRVGKGSDLHQYFCLTDIVQLLYQAQLGSIEFHIWASKKGVINKPDIMTFDLDPDKDMPLATLRQGVWQLKDLLDKLGLQSFVKTSGQKGYHILIPMKNGLDWNKLFDLAQNIAKCLVKQNPKLFTDNIRLQNRKGKIFVDFLRNKKGATCVAPYSLRAKPNLPISAPIAWQELEKIAPNDINISNIFPRLKQNPWCGFCND